ncbi:glycosyltransferase family 58 protein [Daedalea quercina L-15889]|uniref:Dol-P-Man:Man(5)GlcNAc(2)-PP-Dol alpha-1,3-mannosyltransferase n=1 Tax=Daedalea quercina L-15889 TaxID=1314783 RepID=A0A165PGZ9_9APHY|nr:glycosyltransferase family 58 protein [Daedalea quercina L-15889]
MFRPASGWRRPTWLLAYDLALSLLTNPQYFYVLAALVVVGDAILTELIIRFVPYTEIDWETYIYQLELYLKGERDYSLISGPTGPIVYPAGHVHIHHALFRLTDSGNNIKAAQQIYAALYIALLALTCGIYGRAGVVPNWVVLLLPLSKRLHSIFVLRLFNDCWMAVLAHAAVLAYAYAFDLLGTALLGCALSVKMSALLYLPGLLVVLFKRRGLIGTLLHIVILVSTQVAAGLPFLLHHPSSYLKLSYEFSRTFLYKWTVNWRFISEGTFLSQWWARGLLAGHVATLVAFGLFKWCRREGGAWTVIGSGLRNPWQRPERCLVTSDYTITVLFTSNLIGILFARSLHYQFYSWYAMQLPFIAWRTKYPTIVKLILLFGIEYAWNVFPSTTLSSAVLCVANAALVFGIWFGYPEGRSPEPTTRYKTE